MSVYIFFNAEKNVLHLSEYKIEYFHPYNLYDMHENASSIDFQLFGEIMLEKAECNYFSTDQLLQLHKNRTELSVCFNNFSSIHCNLDSFFTELEIFTSATLMLQVLVRPY